MTMRLALTCAVGFTLVGCGKHKEAAPAAAGSDTTASVDVAKAHKPKPAPAAGTPRPQPKLTVTLDGKPVTMATALAWRTWSGDIQLTASSVPVSCDAVTGDMRSIEGNEVTFDVTVANALQPDGKTAMQLRSTYYSGNSNQVSAPAVGTGDGTPGQPTTVDVDFTSGPLVVKGTIDALGCTAPTHGTPPPMPAEMPATLTIAGKKLPIRGAMISKIGEFPQLRLTTGSEGCKQVPFAPPGELEITLAWFKAGPEVGQINLGGSLIGNGASGDQTFDKKKLTVTPAPPVAGDITLKGDIVVSKYPVQLDGKVTAIECPR